MISISWLFYIPGISAEV